MAKRAKRRGHKRAKKFGLPAEAHAKVGRNVLALAKHDLEKAQDALNKGSCRVALNHLFASRQMLGQAGAHNYSGGKVAFQDVYSRTAEVSGQFRNKCVKK